jgi:hypothetical protein
VSHQQPANVFRVFVQRLLFQREDGLMDALAVLEYVVEHSIIIEQ